jgi:formate hydrogenlyase subunit 6/NADH:ubiquinone oxidoreductase subunit I
MAETAKNFFGSYVSKERLTTVEYPEERIPTIENARVFPFLVYDGADWEAGLRCVACQICEKECPPKCIYIDKSKDKKPDFVGKQQFYPTRFDIDVSVCMSCQICVEVCPFEAIKMDTQFELATTTVSAACSTTARNWRSRTSTITRFIPPRQPKWMPAWPRKRPRWTPRPRPRPKQPPPKPPRTAPPPAAA